MANLELIREHENANELAKYCLRRDIDGIKSFSPKTKADRYTILFWGGFNGDILMIEYGLSNSIYFRPYTLVLPVIDGLLSHGKDFTAQDESLLIKLIWVQRKLFFGMERTMGQPIFNYTCVDKMTHAMDLFIPEVKSHYNEECRNINSPIYEFLCQYEFSMHISDTSFYFLMPGTEVPED